MKRIFEQYPFFLILLPAFVLIHLEKEFHQVISYKFVIDRIIIFFVVPLLLLAIVYVFTKSLKKASLVSFILSFFFFYTGEIKNWLSIEFPGSIWGRYSFLLPVMLIISVLLLYRIIKTSKTLNRLFFICNTGLLLFVVADLVSIVYGFKKDKFQLANDIELADTTCTGCEKPDIYYILLDNYTSSAVLRSNFSYPNDNFENDLQQKGFRILPGAKSNYPYTAFSLGSTFNMSYIRNVDTVNKMFDREYLQALKLVYNGRIFSFLEKEGYRIFNHSLFNIRHHPTTVNSFDNWGYRELFDQYNLFLKIKQDVEPSFLKWAQQLFGKNKYFINDPANRLKLDSLVLQQLEETARASTPEPKFVYAHFLRGHPPYASDSLGNKFVGKPATIEEAYIQQVAWCNRTIKSATDKIIANAKRPLVIIIQGDHGYQVYESPTDERKLAVFHAVYFSNGNYRLYPDSVTNVNTFRIVLNTFFKKNYPLLEDHGYFIR